MPNDPNVRTPGAGGAAAGSPVPDNQGEGNREAAREFNDAEKRFVQSQPGQARIRSGAHPTSDEERELERAEEAAKQHAKAQDSNRMA